MRTVTFSKLINDSWERTRVILFRPVIVKKWLLLLLITFLAGQYAGGGCRLNLNLPGPTREETQETRVESREKGVGVLEENAGKVRPVKTGSESPEAELSELTKAKQVLREKCSRILKDRRLLMLFIAAGISGLLIIIAVFVLLTWLGARFSFIFIESVVKNDASIKRPFRENKIIGNSLFIWYLVVSIFFLLLWGLSIGALIFTLFKAGVFAQGAEVGLLKIFAIIAGFVPWFIVLILAGLLAWLFVVDFVQPVMFRNKIRVMKAWRQFFSILKQNKKGFLLYILLKIGLGILVSMAIAVVSVVVWLGFLVPAGSLLGIFFLGLKFSPELLHPILIGILVLLGVPLLIAYIIFVNCLFLPAPIFFRTFSLKFLGNLNDRYNLYEGAFIAEL